MPQYQVQPGDTLYDIAQKTTGDGNRWKELYDSNKPTIGSDPGMIQPGQVLSIPYDQQAVNEGNSMQNGMMSNPQSNADYPAPNIQSGGATRYPPPAGSTYAPPPTGASQLAGSSQQSSYSQDPGFPPAGSQSQTPTSGWNTTAQQPLTLAGSQQSLSPQKGGLSPYQQSYDQGRTQQGYATTGGYPQQPSATPAYGAGPPAYGQAQSRADQLASLNPQQADAISREQSASQFAPGYGAQMGVTVKPPMQNTIDQFQQAAQMRQYTGMPTTTPTPPVGPMQARPAQGYGPGGYNAGPQQSQMVQWPVPPSTGNDPYANTVTPLAYQGAFQNPNGSPRSINAYTGYLGQPNTNPTNPYVQQGQQAMPPGVNQAPPQAVIVIQADGSQLVYNPSTGQWTKR